MVVDEHALMHQDPHAQTWSRHAGARSRSVVQIGHHGHWEASTWTEHQTCQGTPCTSLGLRHAPKERLLGWLPHGLPGWLYQPE